MNFRLDNWEMHDVDVCNPVRGLCEEMLREVNDAYYLQLFI